MTKKKNHWLGPILLTIVLIILGIATFAYLTFHPIISFNPADVPPITANPIDANRLFAVSKFRSDDGHDYSVNAWDGEICRSMKHYLNWNQNQVNNQPVRSQPSPDHPNINVYAPFDGAIVDIEQEHTPIGHQVHIASNKNPSYFVILFHIDLLPGLKVGSRVSSGERIATVGPMDGIDVAYEALMMTGKTVYLSIFQYMTPQAFAPYAKLGFRPDDFILSRAQADALGYGCNGEQFVHPMSFYTSGAYMTEGQVLLGKNPYQYLYNQQNQQSY